MNENKFIYETFLTREFPFTLTVKVTDKETNLYEDCNQFDNYKSNFITARNRLVKKLENIKEV